MNFNDQAQRSSDAIKVHCWQVGKSDKAYLFSTTPKNNREGKQAWVPRSMIEHVTRFAAQPNEWQECVVTMPLWMAEQKGLA